MNTRQPKNPTPNIPRASGCAAPAGKTGNQGDLSERARVACFSASLFSRKEKARSSAALPKWSGSLPGVRNGQARSLQRPARSCIREANRVRHARAGHAPPLQLYRRKQASRSTCMCSGSLICNLNLARVSPARLCRAVWGAGALPLLAVCSKT